MEEYDQIMSLDSVLPFVVGYAFHGVMAVVQVILGLVFILSGGVGLFTRKNFPAMYNYIGVMISEETDSRKIFGALLLVSGILMVAPLMGGMPMSVSMFSLLAALCLTLCFSFFSELGSDERGSVSRGLITLFCAIAITITSMNQQNPVASMKQIFTDISTYRPKEQQWQNEYDMDAPKVGDYAPDFKLLTVSGDRKVRLSEFIGDKPTVLFLGANTCPVFSAGMESINQLQRQYKDKVNFVGVYVSEPHAIDEWPLARTKTLKAWENWMDHPVAVDLKQAVTYRQRQFAAKRMKETLVNDDILLLVDGMNNQVNNTWVGRPARLYLISKEGKIIYNPGKGPYSFNPDHLEPLLKSML